MALAADSHANLYDAAYYADGCGEVPYARTPTWLAFYDGIAARIIADIAPRTVLDAGCALGMLVEGLRGRGVEAFGVDISAFAIANVAESIRPYCRQGSVTDPLPQGYDLIVSIEVLEHMPKESAERAIANFCAATDDVLFSSTPFDYREATHFNVQPPEYWAEQFARHGFYRDVDFDASFMTQWAARFRRRAEPVHRIVREYERRFWMLAKESADLRAAALDHRSEIQRLSQAVQHLEAQREAFTNTPGWRLLCTLQNLRGSLAPPGSRRDRWLGRILDRSGRS